MSDTAILNFPDGKSIELPVITGRENEKALDISRLRAETGHITLDPGYGNTGSCQSSITFLDGEKGILRYRGIPIEVLAEKASFLEVAYLVIYGTLPTEGQLTKFSEGVNHHALLHEDMKHFFSSFSTSAHPMAILSAMVASLSGYYTEAAEEVNEEQMDLDAIRLFPRFERWRRSPTRNRSDNRSSIPRIPCPIVPTSCACCSPYPLRNTNRIRWWWTRSIFF